MGRAAAMSPGSGVFQAFITADAMRATAGLDLEARLSRHAYLFGRGEADFDYATRQLTGQAVAGFGATW